MVVIMCPLVSGSVHATGVTNADTYPFVNGGGAEVNNAETALRMLAASAPSKQNSQQGSTKSMPFMFDSSIKPVTEQVSPLTPLNAVSLPAGNQPMSTVKDIKAATWQAGRHDRLAGMAGWSEEKRMARSQQSLLVQSSKTVLAGRAKYIKPRICPAFPNGFMTTAQQGDVRGSTPLQRSSSAPCLPADDTSRMSTPKVMGPRGPVPRHTGWIGWTPQNAPSRRFTAPDIKKPFESTDHVSQSLGCTISRREGTPKKPHSKIPAGVDQDGLNPSIPFSGFPNLSFLRGF